MSLKNKETLKDLKEEVYNLLAKIEKIEEKPTKEFKGCCEAMESRLLGVYSKAWTYSYDSYREKNILLTGSVTGDIISYCPFCGKKIP